MNNNQIVKNQTFDFLIIGFGISGITCSINILNTIPNAKIVVIESREKFGGVWNDALPTSCLQTDRKYYKLSSLEYPENFSRFPNKSEMLSYFNLAIHTYDLKNRITFFYNTLALDYNKILLNSKIIWQVNTKHNYLNTEKLINTKNILFCYGLNSYKLLPKNINPNILNGKTIIHSKNLSKSLKLLNRAKKILIVGNGASGCDILNYLYEQSKNQKFLTSKEITMIYRSNKYYIDRYIGGVSGSFILSKSFLEFFEHCPKLINTFLVTLANIFVFKNYLDLPGEKINSKNIVGSMIINKLLKENRGSKPNQTFTYLNESLLEVNSLINNKVIVKTDNSLISELDLVIFATGYKHIYPITFMKLYKYTIPINSDWTPIQNVGFFGMNPRYNFIEGVENQIKFYLELYRDKLKIQAKMPKSQVKQWIETTQLRKQKNNLDFMDCTYQLFEKD